VSAVASTAATAGLEVRVHVFSLLADDARLDALAATLAPDERERAARFCFERDRRRFVAARGQLRAILAGYGGVAPERLRFRYGARGKPSLADGCNPDGIRFNLSHSDDLALVAIARGREVGADLECVRPLDDLFVSRCLAPQEQAALRALPAEEGTEALMRYWVRKEAFMKATGLGLGQRPELVEFLVDRDAPPRLATVNGDRAAARRYSVVDLTPAAGYVAAVVAEGQGWWLR
jgi:4'-phosphopantetheinyl transferase